MKSAANFLLGSAVLLFLLAFLALKGSFGSGGAKLVEWGMDTPPPKFVKEHIREMEKLPFDGLVLDLDANTPKSGVSSSLSWNCWSPNPIDLRDYSDSLAALKSTDFRCFTDNFIRFNVTPGNVDWFDKKFCSVLSNAFSVA